MEQMVNSIKGREEILSLAIEKKNLEFLNECFRIAASSSQTIVLDEIYKLLKQKLSAEKEHDMQLSVYLLRLYNYLASADIKENEEGKDSFSIKLDKLLLPNGLLTQNFHNVREHAKNTLLIDSITQKDILLSCVELQAELIYPQKSGLSADHILSHYEIVEYMLNWMENPKFLFGLIQLINKMGKGGNEFTEELIIKLKDIKMNCNKLPSSLSKEAAIKEINNQNIKSANSKLLVSFLLHEYKEYQEVLKLLSPDKINESEIPLDLYSYFYAVSNLEQQKIQEPVMETIIKGCLHQDYPNKNQLFHLLQSRNFCKKGSEAEGVSCLMRVKEENKKIFSEFETDKMNFIYDSLIPPIENTQNEIVNKKQILIDEGETFPKFKK